MVRRGLLTAAMGGQGLSDAFVRGQRLVLQHATAHAKRMAEVRQQAAHTTQVRATRHVLHMEARGRAHIAATLLALHSTWIEYIAQCRMYGAAAR